MPYARKLTKNFEEVLTALSDGSTLSASEVWDRTTLTLSSSRRVLERLAFLNYVKRSLVKVGPREIIKFTITKGGQQALISGLNTGRYPV